MSFLQKHMKLCAVSERTSSARLRGQAELGCHLAAVHPTRMPSRNAYPGTLSRFYPWFYLYVISRDKCSQAFRFFFLQAKKSWDGWVRGYYIRTGTSIVARAAPPSWASFNYEHVRVGRRLYYVYEQGCTCTSERVRTRQWCYGSTRPRVCTKFSARCCAIHTYQRATKRNSTTP